MMKNYIFMTVKNCGAYALVLSFNTCNDYIYIIVQMELAKEEKCEFLPFLSPHKVGVECKKTI